MSLIDARNEMSHTYDFKRFEAVIKQTNERHLPCLGELREKLAEADINANNMITQDKGGSNELENLQLLCNRCNSTKGTGTMEDLKARLKKQEEGMLADM